MITPINAARKEIKMEFEEKDKTTEQIETDQIISEEQEKGELDEGFLATSSPLMNKKKMMQEIK